MEFFREVKIELLKVTFPTRQETLGSTLVVLALTTIVAIYLGFSDWALAKFMRLSYMLVENYLEQVSHTHITRRLLRVFAMVCSAHLLRI